MLFKEAYDSTHAMQSNASLYKNDINI